MSSPESKLAKQWSSLCSIENVAGAEGGKPVTHVLNSLAILSKNGTCRLATGCQPNALCLLLCDNLRVPDSQMMLMTSSRSLHSSVIEE